MSVEKVKQQEKLSNFLRHTETLRFINTRPSAFSLTILNTLGRGGIYIYRLLIDRLWSG